MAREDSENEEREIGGGITIPFESVKRRIQEVLPETGDRGDIKRRCKDGADVRHCEAAEDCEMQNRSVIKGEDLIFCVERIGFSKNTEPLTTFPRKFQTSKTYDRLLGSSSSMVKALLRQKMWMVEAEEATILDFLRGVADGVQREICLANEANAQVVESPFGEEGRDDYKRVRTRLRRK